MEGIAKQQAGFKFGKWSLIFKRTIGDITHNGRTYRLCEVETAEGIPYLSLRLYNEKRRFIKQFLFEPEITWKLAALFEIYLGDKKVKE